MLERVRFCAALVLLIFIPTFAAAQSEKKVAYGILIDNTGTLRSQLPQVKILGKGVVNYIHQRGPISLFNFTSQGELGRSQYTAVVDSGIEWSQDKNLIANYIDGLTTVGGHTTLMDAIHSMAEKLNTKVKLDDNTFAGKVIILITDGEDRASKIKEKQLIKELKESGIKVYAVGLLQELAAEGMFIGGSPRRKAESFLKKITKETGGRVVFPKSNQNAVDELFSKLLEEPLHQ